MTRPEDCAARKKWPLAKRFWDQVDRSGGPTVCWPYLGFVSPRGYGQFSIKNRSRPAHVVAYELDRGRQVPKGLMVCHACDAFGDPLGTTYRRCCNPFHLWVGTGLQNRIDSSAKGRAACGKRQGAWTKPERHPRGERHGFSVLTAVQCESIRRLRAEGVPLKDLAARFPACESTISNIANGKTRVHG